MTVLLVVVALGFAFSMGAHYTGACMGMPHALRAISGRRALLVMAPLTLIGATFASHGVEHTVARELLTGNGLSVSGLLIVLGVAFALTSLFTERRIPTSTIQILVFSVIGAALAANIGIEWSHIAELALIWVCAPIVAAGLGYLLTKLLDRIPAVRGDTQRVREGATAPWDSATDHPSAPARPRASAREVAPTSVAGGWLAWSLIAVGALASFAMGSNDVANATGALVGTHTFSLLVAGLIGGIGLAAGVLTWGRPLLRRIAFDIVQVDRAMATAAQLVQAVVVLGAVAFGFFTSMNQALVGAMAGAGAARGRHTVNVATLVGIVRGWVIGPGAAVALSYALARLVGALAGIHCLQRG